MIRAVYFWFIAAILVLGASSSVISSVTAQQFSPTTLEHSTVVNISGDIIIRDTVNFGPAVNIPNPLTLDYSTSFKGKIAGFSAIFLDGTEASLSTQFTGNSSRLSLAFEELDQGKDQTLVVEFYLSRAIEPLGLALYNFQYPEVPQLNFNVASINSTLVLPPTTRLSEGPEGFTRQELAGSEVWSKTFAPARGSGLSHNITLELTSLEAQFYLMEIRDASRTISVTSQGEIIVRDSLLINNYDERTILSLKIQTAGDSTNTIQLIPSTNPPLFNPFTTAIIDDIIDLRAIKRTITEGSQTLLIYEYPLPASQISSDGISITISVPPTTPAESILQKYRVNVEAPPGFFIRGPSGFSGLNVTASDVGDLAVNIAVGPAWSVSDIMPVASIIFLAIFSSTFLVTRRPTKEEHHPEGLSEVVNLIEIKNGHIINALAEIDRSEVSSQGEVQRIRKNLYDNRSRTLNRLAQVRSNLDPSASIKLSQLFILDKEVDKSARDFFAYYEQQVSKVKGKELTKAVSSHRKRLEQMLTEITQLRLSEIA